MKKILLTVVLVSVGGALVYVSTRSTIDTRQGETAVRLERIGDAVQAFNRERGRALVESEGLDVVTRALGLDPNTARDAWGRPLLFRCLEPSCAKFIIRSIGPDGRDSSGAGDDISREVASK